MPGLQVIMITVYADSDSIFESLAAGASGYLLKPVQSHIARIYENLRHDADHPMDFPLGRNHGRSFDFVGLRRTGGGRRLQRISPGHGDRVNRHRRF